MIKPSRYNFVFEYEKLRKTILYNSLSNSALLYASSYFSENLQPLLKQTSDQIFSKQGGELVAELKKQRFLIESTCDEQKMVKDRFQKGQTQSDIMTITIACTIQCNFRCTYCFEPHRNEFLSEEHFTKLLNLIEQRASTLKQLNITWFGGEPLIMAVQIAKWSKKILSITKEHKIIYQATVVTNGSLLNPKNIQRLKDSQVRGMQVTIDGPKEIHDKSRPSVGGNGTYDKIVSNLEKYRESLKGINTTIRVNVSKSNLPFLSTNQKHLRCQQT